MIKLFTKWKSKQILGVEVLLLQMKSWMDFCLVFQSIEQWNDVKHYFQLRNRIRQKTTKLASWQSAGKFESTAASAWPLPVILKSLR